MTDSLPLRHTSNTQNQYQGVVTSLVKYTGLRVFITTDKAETAKLLNDLAEQEATAGARILVPTSIPEKKNQV